MRKFLITMMCIIMVVCFMPTMAMAASTTECTDENCIHVAAITKGGTTTHFDTLAEAVKAVHTDESYGRAATIEVLQDSTGSSIGMGYNTLNPDTNATSGNNPVNITINFNNHTYTLDKPGVGSSGTTTSGFQLLKGSTVKFKGGKIDITADNRSIYRIFQNYANLTLEDMEIDGTNQYYYKNYLLALNCGDNIIIGNTSIYSNDSSVDSTSTVLVAVYDWVSGGYHGANLTINTTDTIRGVVYTGGDGDANDQCGSFLKVEKGTVGGIVKEPDEVRGIGSITVASGVASLSDVSEYIPEGYVEYAMRNGTYIVKESVEAPPAFTTGNYWSELNGKVYTELYSAPYIPPTPPTPTDNVTNSGSTTTDNASTNADLSGSTSTSNGTTSATVDKTTADKIVDKVVENKSTEVVIDATANTTTAANSTTIAQVTIPTETLGAIAEKTEADVTIKTDVAEVKMDNAAVAAVSEQAEGDTVQIIAEKIAEETDKVEFELKVVCSDGKVISNFNGGNIAVTVALPKAMAEKKVVCVYIDDNGHMSKVEGQKNADGTYTFVTGHFSSYAILAEEEADAAIAAQKEAIKNIKIKLTSKQVKTKAGKKAVKITWTAAAGDKVLDGVEVFRSKEKNKGYGTEPFYTSTKGGDTGSYTNTKSLKKGTKYYYRVRGYVLVNGEKVYTDYSTKAWRTVK